MLSTTLSVRQADNISPTKFTYVDALKKNLTTEQQFSILTHPNWPDQPYIEVAKLL